MNERIAKLLPIPFRKQGQQIAADGDTKVFCDMYSNEQMIEFTELIVRECANRATWAQDTDAPDIGDEVLKHFGVEE